MAIIDSSHLPASGWAGMVGVPGGIPTDYTLFCNVKESIPGYSGALAAGDGVTDDTAAIQAAVDRCPNGQYVYIPEGSYSVTGIGRGGINNYDYIAHPFSMVIRGAGPDKTRIFNDVTHDDAVTFNFDTNSSVTTTIVSGNTRGSTSIVWGGNPGYCEVGCAMVIARQNSESGFNPQGDNGYMTESCSQVVRITAIDGDTVHFTPALNEGFPSDSIIVYISQPTRCGVEDLYIEYRNDVNGLGVRFGHGVECWVKNVESRMCRHWHIMLERCYRCEARENYVHETWDGGGNSGYGICLYASSSNCLVENNIMWRCRHSMIFEWGGQGNVVAYNYSKHPINEKGPSGAYPYGYPSIDHPELPGGVPGNFTDYIMGDMTTHGGNPRYNLYEGNICATIRLDNILGGSDHMCMHRNRVLRKSIPTALAARFGRDVQRDNLYAQFSGNVYHAVDPSFYEGMNRWGSTDDVVDDSDPAPEATANIDGDYVEETDTTTWAGADHTLPASYYLTAKPAWWDDAFWPAIGTDLDVKFGANPAFRRFEGAGGGEVPPLRAGRPGTAALLLSL